MTNPDGRMTECRDTHTPYCQKWLLSQAHHILAGLSKINLSIAQLGKKTFIN